MSKPIHARNGFQAVSYLFIEFYSYLCVRIGK